MQEFSAQTLGKAMLFVTLGVMISVDARPPHLTETNQVSTVTTKILLSINKIVLLVIENIVNNPNGYTKLNIVMQFIFIFVKQ